ncbi:MAG: TetR/AcrR family transcriptional regulator [Actinobacteria bacterium]|jgi:AcrR family transcriptional regulator|nr:MAG: TetR/AcrR family transcriptional regulator [Actinomycetota bacterium]
MAKQRLPAEKRKQSILKATERCLARKGYYNCTTADIAAEAGITEPVLYQHFQDKRDIVSSLRNEALDDISNYVVRRVVKRKTPLEGLHEAAEAIFDYTVRHRSKMRAYYYSIPELGKGGLRRSPVERLHRLHEAVAYMLEEAQRQGAAVDDMDAPDFAWSFISLVEIVYIANALGLNVPFKQKDAYMDLIDRLLSTIATPARLEER